MSHQRQVDVLGGLFKTLSENQITDIFRLVEEDRSGQDASEKINENNLSKSSNADDVVGCLSTIGEAPKDNISESSNDDIAGALCTIGEAPEDEENDGSSCSTQPAPSPSTQHAPSADDENLTDSDDDFRKSLNKRIKKTATQKEHKMLARINVLREWKIKDERAVSFSIKIDPALACRQEGKTLRNADLILLIKSKGEKAPTRRPGDYHSVLAEAWNQLKNQPDTWRSAQPFASKEEFELNGLPDLVDMFDHPEFDVKCKKIKDQVNKL